MTVIFIGSPERNPKGYKHNLKRLFLVSPSDVAFRIFGAFVPPLTSKFQRVYVDLQGPLLAVLLLAALLNYGYSFKTRVSSYSPTETVVLYSAVMPVLCFILCKLGRSCITLSETISLIGYGLYGHFLTLFSFFLFFKEHSNFFFFVCLIVFGGLSTLRITLVILGTLGIPVARLLICSVISVVNILFMIFIHFAFMQTTFVV